MAGRAEGPPIAAPRRCEVLVIGGGPGGAATASLLALSGREVVLIEKAVHPRFHIGESLLPYSLPILRRLGVLEATERIGVHKRGAEFVSPDGTHEEIFDFSRALFGGPDHAFQVRRSEFDKLLIDRAAELGVEVLQGTTATVEELGETSARVRTSGPGGEAQAWEAAFLVDASGRSTVTAKLLAQKSPDPRNTSASVFGHFLGIPRRSDARGGNIRLYLTEPGWMWQIPLRDDVTSFGLVAPGDYFQNRAGSIEALFNEHCARHPHIAALMEGAEAQGPLRSTGNFSYRSSSAAAGCHVKVGDAYGFLDPIFSTGVHLALLSADAATETINSCLERPATRQQTLAEYDELIHKRISYLSWFVYNIQDSAFREMLMNPKNIFGVERAMISILAGDLRRDLRLRLRIALFKAFRYIVKTTAMLRTS